MSGMPTNTEFDVGDRVYYVNRHGTVETRHPGTVVKIEQERGGEVFFRVAWDGNTLTSYTPYAADKLQEIE